MMGCSYLKCIKMPYTRWKVWYGRFVNGNVSLADNEHLLPVICHLQVVHERD